MMNYRASIRGIAFVDVCGTLIDLNTLTEFVKFIHETNKISFIKRMYFSLSLLLNRMGFLRGKRLRNKAVKSLAGLQRDVIESIAKEFFDNRCLFRVNNELIEHLGCLKESGFKIVLVSATLDVIAEVIAKKMGFDGVLATQLEFHDDCVTGEVSGEYCEKSEKVRRIVVEYGIDIHTEVCVTAYGNTLDDLDMLEWSSFPHAIWATDELRTIAINRSWPIGVHPAIDAYDLKVLIGSKL